ncbi:MAG: 7TM diverse intracellular signaling domain-containing protein [Cyclobacteriaceae bacterium]
MSIRLFFFIWVISISLSAQEQPIIKLSQWQRLGVLDPYVMMYVDSTGAQSIETIASQRFFLPPHNYLEEEMRYPKSKSPHYFRVRIVNDTKDTARNFFIVSPQKGSEIVSLSQANGLKKIPSTWHKQRFINHTRIYTYTLLPEEEREFIIKLAFPIYAGSFVYLYMDSDEDRALLFVYLKGRSNNPQTFMWFFCGMLLMMFLYIVLKFIQIRSREYFYYGAYIFFFLLFFLMRTVGASGNESILYGDFFSGIANDQLQACAYIMYYFFVKHFLSTEKNLPTLHRVLNLATIFLLIYMLVDFTLYWFPDLMNLKFRIWDVVRLLLLCITSYSIVQIIRQKIPLGSYIVWGGLLLSVLGLLAMLFSFFPEPIANLLYPFDQPLTYFQLGVAAELICFSLGLGYKSRLVEVEKTHVEQTLKIQSERQEFERYRSMAEAREVERSRIAKDLHDGVGGLLSGVRISLANIQTRLQLKQDDELIFERSMDMLDGSMQELRRVAHAMKPPSLEVFGLKAALRDYVEAVNSMKTIKIIFQTIGEERRFESEPELIIYRIIQELINNVLKHAQAAECLVQVSFLVDHLSITIEDNGKGFDVKKETNGMGWGNIRQRIDFLKGSIDLHSAASSGTSVQINVPF